MNKEKLIKLLEKMKATYESLEKAFSNAEDYESAIRYRVKAQNMGEVLVILKSEEYMNNILVLYGIN